MSLYLGVDPGKSGAAALITHASAIVSVQKFDVTEMDICEWFGGDASHLAGVVGILEYVSSMPKDGVVSAFKFGTSYGFLRGMLLVHGIRFATVTSSKWQRTFGLISKKGETKTHKKNRHKARAQELFPGVKVTHAIADALLLADYCRGLNA